VLLNTEVDRALSHSVLKLHKVKPVLN